MMEKRVALSRCFFFYHLGSPITSISLCKNRETRWKRHVNSFHCYHTSQEIFAICISAKGKADKCLEYLKWADMKNTVVVSLNRLKSFKQQRQQIQKYPHIRVENVLIVSPKYVLYVWHELQLFHYCLIATLFVIRFSSLHSERCKSASICE